MSIFGGSGQSVMGPDQLPLQNHLPYQVRASVLTPAEVSFYHVLTTVVNDRAVICPKVGLKDIVFIPGPHNRNYFGYFGRISQKHVDYVLCNPKSMQPLVAIELDDQSHHREDRAERDAFIDRVFGDANLPLVHFVAANGYNTSSVAAAIEPYLGDNEVVRRPPVDAIGQSTPPLCPRHGVPMVLRTARQGANAGQQFYGCPNYPDCREIVRLEQPESQ